MLALSLPAGAGASVILWPVNLAAVEWVQLPLRAAR